MQFSELAAVAAGLQPRQHQLLLQVAGAPDGTDVTISYAADRLGLKHNSTVELVDRSVREGLMSRVVDIEDRRRAILRISRKGRRVLEQLSGDHARELNELGPRMMKALEQVRVHANGAGLQEVR